MVLLPGGHTLAPLESYLRLNRRILMAMRQLNDNIPHIVGLISDEVSKADLIEAAYLMAVKLCGNDQTPPDRLIDELNRVLKRKLNRKTIENKHDKRCQAVLALRAANQAAVLARRADAQAAAQRASDQ